jgi:hypothetical protein
VCPNAKFVRFDVTVIKARRRERCRVDHRIPEDSIDFDLREEEASLYVKAVLVSDAFTDTNSFDLRRQKVHAVINTLRREWRGTTNRRSHSDCADACRGNFCENSPTIEVIAPRPRTPATVCLARPAGSSFKSIPALFVLLEGQLLREGYVE